jgi:hypothetical protein
MLNASNSMAARPNIRTASAIQSYSSQKRILTSLHCRSFSDDGCSHAHGGPLPALSIFHNGLGALPTDLFTSTRQCKVRAYGMEKDPGGG